MDSQPNIIRRHPIVAFYILAFAISWLGWIPGALYERGMFPFTSPLFNLLGGVGPTLAAVIVILARREENGIRNLFGGLLRLRASAGWYVVTFGFWIVVTLLAMLGVGILSGQGFPAVGQFAWGSLPLILVTMLLSNVWEEIGWRGFALPRLQERYGDLMIAIIMGVLWEIWHLPLILSPASPMSSVPWYGGVLFSISLTVIYTWLYQNTARSLFFVTIFHAMSNTAAFVTLELGAYASSYLYVVGVTVIVATAIILIYGPQRFTKKRAEEIAQNIVD
jgi:membrane protease YdiL (CAAX protease family)